MKLFAILAIAAFGLTAANRITDNVYPCPHSGTTRLAHVSSCSKFVQCVNGFAVEEDCATGLFYSEEHQQCTTPELANCRVESSPCPRWTDPENLVFLSNGRDCQRYFLCYDAQPLQMECAPGLSFDARTNKCSADSCSVSQEKEGFVDQFIIMIIYSPDHLLVLWTR